MQVEEVSMEVSMSVHEGCQAWKLSSILEKNLTNDRVYEFFEIQTKAIPQILDCWVVVFLSFL